MLLFFVGIIFGFLTLCIAHMIQRRHQILEYMGKFPTPLPRNPIFGSLLNLPKKYNEVFLKIMGDHKKYGKNMAFWGLFNDHQLFVSDPKDLEKILSSTKLISKAKEYFFLEDWLGTGLLMSTGKKWHARRKIITPTFHFKILEDFIQIFNSQSDVLLKKLEPFSGTNEEFNIYRYTTLCALDVICEASMGTKINAQDKPDSEYVNAVKEMSQIFLKRFFNPLKQFKFLFPLTSMYRSQKRALKILHGFTQGVIESRRNRLVKELEEKKVDPERKMCFLDLLLQANVDGKPLTNSDIREEVDTFMFEGHDTTTSAISFALYHLSRHPEIQERVFEEIVSVLGTNDKNAYLNYNTLQDLKYLEMVIKETLRITPPVPTIARELTEETEIGGVKVPPGMTISLIIYALHHSEDIYPDPKKFDPERFTLENSQKRGPYDFVPFSAGNRNCIGQKFAMLEVKSMVAKIVMNYKLFPGDSEAKIFADIVLKSENGINVKIQRR